MSKHKLRIHNTQLDNLISNLRGEIGEVITSWILLRHGSRQPTKRRCGEWSGPAVDWARCSAMIASKL
jgi:hypothetical protein